MLKSQKNSNSFTIIELIISITIMFILGGIFLLNYNTQKDKVDLANSLSIVSQEVRKAQSFAISQTALPPECGTGQRRDVFGVYFEKGKNYVSLYVDKDGNGIPNIVGDCNCESTNECIERKYFSPSIQINNITPGYNDTTGWIGFSREDLSVQINDGDLQLQLDFCPKSNCSANTKSILMSNKGMVDVQ